MLSLRRLVGEGVRGGMVRLGDARGPAPQGSGRSRLRPAALRARRLRRAVLVGALAAVLSLVVPLVRARVRERAAQARAAAVIDSLGAARALAGAMETYDLERGALPVTVGAAALERALAPYLPRPILGDGAGPQFAYTLLPHGYTLRFTPAEGGISVLLQVTLGVGGTAVAGGRSAVIGW